MISSTLTWLIHAHRDHFMNAPSQWEMTLHCNVISHWLCAYPEWPLCIKPICSINPLCGNAAMINILLFNCCGCDENCIYLEHTLNIRGHSFANVINKRPLYFPWEYLYMGTFCLVLQSTKRLMFVVIVLYCAIPFCIEARYIENL